MAVALAQAVVVGDTVFASPPANGTIVSIALAATTDLTSTTVTDSNSVALTQRILVTDGGSHVWAAVYDYTVVGSPTATYTVTGGAPAKNSYNISGATLASTAYTSAFAAVLGATLIGTIAGVNNGDLQISLFRTSTAGTGASTLFSNGSTVSDIANPTIAGAHAFATATISSLATVTTGSATNPGAMVYASYTAGGGGGGVAGSIFPFEGVYPGGMPGMP